VGVVAAEEKAEDRGKATYRAHAAALVWFATVLVGPSEAADVVSAAVLRCLASPSWENVENRKGYLYRAVVNEARSAHRTAVRRLAREQQAARRDAVTDPERDLDIWRAVAALSIRQRAVTVLTYVEDLTVADVAGRLGLTEGAVRRHLGRARARLRRVLDG
jgi:RNA polymerase sigma factor (sigma-70 family)